MTFFHGGSPGLSVGTRLVPRPDLADSAAYEQAWTRGLDPDCTARVYFTDNVLWASIYTLFYKERFGVEGWVYEVMPEGKIERDRAERHPIQAVRVAAQRDLRVSSFRAPAAVIVGVVYAADGDESRWWTAYNRHAAETDLRRARAAMTARQ